MGSVTKPTIIAFPGAWHPETALTPFINDIRAAGYPAEAHRLRTVNNPDAVVADDEAYMRSVLISHLDQGKDVVLLVHSFGGFGGSGAIRDLDRKTRAANGQTGGLVGIIYLAAFIATEPVPGEEEAPPGAHLPPWISPNKETGLSHVTDPVSIFYADCDLTQAAEVAKTLLHHSVKAFGTQPSNIGYKPATFDGRRAYIVCEQDLAVPAAFQRAMLEKTGVEWIVKTLDSSHSPFLSIPAKTVETVGEIILEFEKAA